MAESPDTRARRLRHEAAYVAAHETWFAALSPGDQMLVRELGLQAPKLDQYRYGPAGEASETERPEVSIDADPASMLEPIETLETELGAAFAKAIDWACQGNGLVEIGRRLSIILWIWQKPLIEGMAIEIERDLETEFVDKVDDGQSGGGGALLGTVFEWARRGGTLSQWGQRMLVIAYVIRPQAIGSQTLQSLGAMHRKTRQAIDRLVNDFRDTFGGMRARTMRPESTRTACRNAQLLRA